MKARKRYEIDVRLQGKHHLQVLEGSTYDIPRRVEEYDRDMFVVFNTRKRQYEIHSLEYPVGDTFQLTLPYDELDARAIRHIWENDLQVHGRKIFDNIVRSEEAHEKQKQRDYKNWIRDVASETQSMFAKDAWSM